MTAMRCSMLGLALGMLVISTASTAGGNAYEKPIVGQWEIEGETDLFVFEDGNVCYREDEDGLKTSEKGRWSATASKLTIEVKYNGKKFRSVFSYEKITDDEYKLVLEKALIDGKPRRAKKKKKELKAKRWKG